MEQFWFDTERGVVLVDELGRPVFGYPSASCCCDGGGPAPDPICNCVLIDAAFDLYDGSAGACWTHTDDVAHEFEYPPRYCNTGSTSWRRDSSRTDFITCQADYCDLTGRPCFRFGNTPSIFGTENGYVWESAGPSDPNSTRSIAYEIWYDSTNVGVSKFAAGQGLTSSGRLEIRITSNTLDVRYRQSAAGVGRAISQFLLNGCHHVIAQWDHAAAELVVYVDGVKDTQGVNSSPTFLTTTPASGTRHFGKFNTGTEGATRYGNYVDLATLAICDTLFDDARAADHYAEGPP